MTTTVCQCCFYKYRTDINFQGCTHGADEQIEVTWNNETQNTETKTQVRPFPELCAKYVRKFVMCNPHKKKCVGLKCTYPHGQAELENWNRRLSALRSSLQASTEDVPISSPPQEKKRRLEGKPIDALKLVCSSCLIL